MESTFYGMVLINGVNLLWDGDRPVWLRGGESWQLARHGSWHELYTGVSADFGLPLACASQLPWTATPTSPLLLHEAS